ncbi:MAG: exo-alpha-sialidase [Candidatus Hydrogenedentes bacterium]|nr:exo-alpha-sialidase [Candidatus Hydrogenedentota bacterium]
MRIVDEGTVVSSAPGTEHQSCTFPGICVLPNGRWLVGFRAAPAKLSVAGQSACFTWSDDSGATWTPPASPFPPPEPGGKPGRNRTLHPTALGGSRVLATLCWVDSSDPSLPFFNETTQGLLDTRVFHALSTDNGESWSQPVPMDTAVFGVPCPTTGPTLVLADGEWACQFELNKHYHDTAPWRHASVLMFSNDQGGTWPGHVVASTDPENRFFYWDQRPALLSDGRVLNVFWTYDSLNAAYVNIHARLGSPDARTWTPLWDIGLPGQPAPPVHLPDGRIALVYVDRTAAPIIKLRTSPDDGATWPGDTELVIARPELPSQNAHKTSMQDAWAEMGRFSIGLPATALTPDGHLLVVYYSGPDTDETDIKWARIAP